MSRRAIIYAFISPLASGVATVFASIATKLISPLAVASLGQLLGSAILCLSFITHRQGEHPSNFRKELPRALRVGFIRGFLGSTLFMFGLLNTEAIKAVFFTKIEPYFVLFWGWVLLKESVKLRELALLAVHLFGALLLSTGGNFLVLGKAQLGDVLIVLSMLVSGYSYIESKKLSAGLGPRLSSAATCLVGGLLQLPLVIAFEGQKVFDSPLYGWVAFLIQVVLFYVIALTLWFAAIHSVRGWVVSALRAIGPLSGVPAAYFLIGETLSFVQLIGGAIVLITSAIIAGGHFRARS